MHARLSDLSTALTSSLHSSPSPSPSPSTPIRNTTKSELRAFLTSLREREMQEWMEQVETPLADPHLSTAAAEKMYKEANIHSPRSSEKSSNRGNEEESDESTLIEIEEVSGEVVSYYDSENNVGYIRIYTFSPSTISLWASAVFHSLQAIKEKYGATRLVIDVRGNGGGYVHLGMQLHHLLFPSEYPIYGVYQLRESDLNAELVKIPDDDSENTFYDPITDVQYNGTDYYYNQYSALFADAETDERFTANYTRPFRMVMDPPDVFASLVQEWPEYPGFSGASLFDPSKIVVVTDGLCGSTCCCFIKHVHETRSARIIGFGHDPHSTSTDYDSGSFCGGTVFNSNTVMGYKSNSTVLELINVTNLPDNFYRSTMRLSWAQHQIHTWTRDAVYNVESSSSSSTPASSSSSSEEEVETGENLLEFKLNPVHDIDTTFFPQYLYDRTKAGMSHVLSNSLSFFDGCYPHEVADDTITCTGPNSTDTTKYGGDNKVYGHPCINGHFAYDVCVFSRCADGYYLDGAFEDGNLTVVECKKSPHLYVYNSSSSSSASSSSSSSTTSTSTQTSSSSEESDYSFNSLSIILLIIAIIFFLLAVIFAICLCVVKCRSGSADYAPV